MIIKVCPTCRNQYQARHSKQKNCTRKCAIVSSKNISEKRHAPKKITLDQAIKSKTMQTNAIRDFWESFVPGKCLARQKWDSSFKMESDA